MPRIPIIQQNQPFGTQNPTQQVGRRQVLPSVTLVPGPSQQIEQFNHPGIHPNVARALNNLQQQIKSAVSVNKADPTSNKNFLRGVQLTNGGSNGASPNVIKHGLGGAYTGYNIHAVYGGVVNSHSCIPPTTAQPSAAFLLLWTSITAFSGQTVTCDLEVYM